MSSTTQPTIHLFCLSYAGGTAQVFRRFCPFLSPVIKLIPIDTPGHGTLLGQPPLERMDDLIDFVIARIDDHQPTRYAIFGHSLGAHLAFIAARKLSDLGSRPPLQLFLSGKAGPSLPFKHRDIHKLSSVEFLNKVREYGGLPDEFFATPELVESFLPVLKADFQAMSTWQYAIQSPLNVPLTVFYGDRDVYQTPEFQLWDQETIHKATHHRFKGNHFFLFDYPTEIGKIISDTLEPLWLNVEGMAR